jgi:23S rRNA pseudouridine1911/1915/1917 synthase
MLDPTIIYEDKDFLAVAKPAGLVVHAAKVSEKKRMANKRGEGDAAEPTLVDWLLARYPEIKTVGDDPAQRPGIVHRLDKATSGIMLVARTQAAFEYFKTLFQKHEIQKTYLAVVFGKPKNDHGVIDAPIGIKNGTLKRSVRSKKMAKPAVTEYKVMKTFEHDGEKYSLLEIKPKTGRTHQIRVHLASIGHAVVGDPLYGRKRQPPDAKRLMLHAISLAFTAPNGKAMQLIHRERGPLWYDY